jgi:hypothetical protein
MYFVERTNESENQTETQIREDKSFMSRNVDQNLLTRKLLLFVFEIGFNPISMI